MIADQVENWITLEQAASQLGISTSKVRRLIEEHILFAVKIDKQPMIPSDIPLSSIRGTMLQLLDLGLTEAEAIEWLYEENDVLGEKPIAALVKGHKAPVRRAAQALG
ncbi:MAG: DNA-binding protein [Actinobacteria bacterium]|nr:DNA-binding protein [Actinomycetota bacterium]